MTPREAQSEKPTACIPDSARIDEEIFGKLRKDLDLYLTLPRPLR